MLRQAREDAAPPVPASTVPEDWHPFQLRDKPPEPVTDSPMARQVEARFQAMIGAATPPPAADDAATGTE